MLSLKAYRKIQCFGVSVHYIHFNIIGTNSYTDQCEVKTEGANLKNVVVISWERLERRTNSSTQN